MEFNQKKIRKLYFTAMVVGILLLSAGFALAVSFKNLDIEKYTVHITSILPFGMSSCSGTIIKNTDNYSEVLTCKHCLAADRETNIAGLKVTKIITSSGEDLAIMVVKGKFKGKEPAVFGAKNEEIKNPVYMFGQPGFVTKYFKKGEIASYTADWGWAKLEVNPGCSGSGLFNENKELIGVVWGAYVEGATGGGFFTEPTGGTKIGIFTPLDKIQNFLKKVR